jgi:hypothetical protein
MRRDIGGGALDTWTVGVGTLDLLWEKGEGFILAV